MSVVTSIANRIVLIPKRYFIQLRLSVISGCFLHACKQVGLSVKLDSRPKSKNQKSVYFTHAKRTS